MIVYIATNQINGKVYIGQTINSLNTRRMSHFREAKNDNNYFHNALRKYGAEGFKWEVIRICDSVESLNAFEEYYILYYNSMNSGYNRMSGGLNSRHTEESNEKNRQAHLGKNNAMWGVSRKSPMEGKKHKPETIKKMREVKIGEKNPMYGVRLTGENNHMYGKRGEKCPNYGMKRSKETIKKMIENRPSVKGKNNPNYGRRYKLSKETKQKMRESRLKYLANQKTGDLNGI